MKRDQLLLLDIINTSILVGLIWTIQLVHYPSFSFVDTAHYQSFQNFHVNAITPLVLPLMMIEVFFLIFNLKAKHFNSVQMKILIVLVAIIWGTTFLISVPIHNQLALGKDSLLIHRLVVTNWIRTAAWSLKLFFLAKFYC